MRGRTLAPDSVRTALLQRLRIVAETLGVDAPPAAGDAVTDAAVLLETLVQRVRAEPEPPLVWLLLVGVSSTFPTADDVLATRRRLQLSTSDELGVWLLEEGFRLARDAGSPASPMAVVSDRLVVDVDFCARHNLHTGIQRVVREVVPRWNAVEPSELVAWTAGLGAMRQLQPLERQRVLAFHHQLGKQSGVGGPHGPAHLVVPWRTTVVLPEVPAEQSTRLEAVARFSGNRVVAIGYDCIPVVSADLLPPVEPMKFVRYLATIKYADRVVAISRSATQEFAGFAAMLPTQGLPGPDVVECELPVEVPPADAPVPPEPTARPTVLVVGSHDPRKNHLSVLFAAERLWREGLRFRLRLIGGRGSDTEEFDRRLREMKRRGRKVRVDRGVDDAGLWHAYRTARFSVFPSLHEGYGLPVAESLACGTPVITSNYGSTAEIAQDGGALVVDPRNDDELTDAMRRLLTDDDLLAKLRSEARGRHVRTWDDYARELRALVEEVR